MSQEQRAGTPATFVLLIAYAVIFFRFDLIEPKDEALRLAGWMEPVSIATGDWWRLLSAQFVHIGLMHLLFNAYFLWTLGPFLEQALGTPRFVLLYFVAGVAGNVACCLWYPAASAGAGGSGALFGFLGAILAMLLRHGRSFADFWRHPLSRNMLGLILVNIVFALLMPIISQTAHLGGLVGGFLVTFFMFKLPEIGRAARRRPLAQRALCAAFLAATTALAVWPVHRTWWTARDLWLHAADMPEQRVAELREALELRGLSTAQSGWLARSGKYRGRVIGELLAFELQDFERGFGLELAEKVGFDAREYNLTAEAINLVLQNIPKEADARVSQDYWRGD